MQLAKQEAARLAQHIGELGQQVVHLACSHDELSAGLGQTPGAALGKVDQHSKAARGSARVRGNSHQDEAQSVSSTGRWPSFPFIHLCCNLDLQLLLFLVLKHSCTAAREDSTAVKGGTSCVIAAVQLLSV